MSEAQRLTQAIRETVESHHLDDDLPGYTQWYVDENAIDCDADEFWRAVETALNLALTSA